MPKFRYAGYPDAKVVDDDENEIQHLVWGDWVKVSDDPPQDGWVEVHSRGTDGWMREADLQEERLLEVVFVDVGQGDGCLVVTPDDKHLVIDAGLSDNMYRFLKWRYAGFKNKWTFKAAVVTHPDSDHYSGFTPLFEHDNVHFESVYHNGIMEEWSPKLGPDKKINGRRYLTHVVHDQAELEGFLAQTDRWTKQSGNRTFHKQYPKLLNLLLEEGRVGDVSILATRPGARHWMSGYEAGKKLSIEVLGPIIETVEGADVLRAFGSKPMSKSLNPGKTKNGHSVILKLQYRDLRLLLGGDLNRSSEHFLLAHYSGLDHDYPYTTTQEDAVVEAATPTLGVDVAKSCHHGAADVTDAMLRTIRSAATVVSSGDEESHAHPRPETLGALGRYGHGQRPLLFSTELMRSTREDEGDARVEVGKLRQRIDDATTDAKKAELQAELDKLVDELTDRNVTVYGAINLRSDGHRAVMAYKLEKPRHGSGGGKKRLTKWDIYQLEKAGNGPLVYSAGGTGH